MFGCLVHKCCSRSQIILKRNHINNSNNNNNNNENSNNNGNNFRLWLINTFRKSELMAMLKAAQYDDDDDDDDDYSWSVVVKYWFSLGLLRFGFGVTLRGLRQKL